LCQTLTDAKAVTGTARSSAQTATGAAPSGGASAGAVTALVACPAQNVAGLGGMSSADGDLVDAARAYVALYDRWWLSLMHGPYNDRDAAHWELVHERQLAWQRYAGLLQAHGLQPPDRRGFARALALR